MIRRKDYLDEVAHLKPVYRKIEPGWWTEDYYIDHQLIRFSGMVFGDRVWRENMFSEENITRPTN